MKKNRGCNDTKHLRLPSLSNKRCCQRPEPWQIGSIIHQGLISEVKTRPGLSLIEGGHVCVVGRALVWFLHNLYAPHCKERCVQYVCDLKARYVISAARGRLFKATSERLSL